MSSSQEQHIDKVAKVPVAMRDKLTDEELAQEHLADSSRETCGTSRENISCRSGEPWWMQKQTERGAGR